jgi:uncharacterized membrane protein
MIIGPFRLRVAIMKLIQWISLLFAGLSFLPKCAIASDPFYSIDSVSYPPPPLNGMTLSAFSLEGVNSKGQVIAIAQYTPNGHAGDTQIEPTYVPMLFQNGQYSTLPIPANTTNGWPAAISELGQITGTAWPQGLSGPQYPLRWSSDQLSILSLGTNQFAGTVSINARGEIGGIVITSSGESSAAWWDASGGLHELGSFGGTSTSVRAINLQGQMLVAGTRDSKSFTLLVSDGVATPLPPITLALQLNNSGHVLGTSLDDDRNLTLCFWDGSHSVAIEPPSQGFVPYTMYLNDSDQAVINWSKDDANGTWTTEVTLWDRGTLYDLNTLLNPDAGWNLVLASGIASDGSIIGEGFENGAFAHFLARPILNSVSIPEPASALLLLLCTPLLVRRNRRRFCQ